jgi:hypothetical protein
MAPSKQMLIEAANDERKILSHACTHLQDIRVDQGDWNLSIYDMAWVLCSDFFAEEDRERHLQALLNQRNKNGFWGDATYLPHSALVDTLAVVMMQVRRGREIQDRAEVARGINELLLRCSAYEHHSAVAFELIAPNFLRWLERKGVTFDLSTEAQAFLQATARSGDYKLAVLRKGPGLFKSHLTLSYTAEIAALIPLEGEELGQLLGMMLSNGAIGLAPAATAAAIVLCREHGREAPEGLYRYLQSTYDDYGQKGFPDLHPAYQTRRLWTMLPWILSGDIFDVVAQAEGLEVVKQLYEDVDVGDVRGVSWDDHNKDLPDLDDTAVALVTYYILRSRGKDVAPITPKSLLSFQRQDGSFVCYPYELHPSPAALFHVLMSLERGEDALGKGIYAGSGDEERIREAILAQLEKQLDPEHKSPEILCHDKWHATWTYGAQRWLSVRVLQERFPNGVEKVVKKALADQKSDGGWGQEQPTVEETSYIVSGLAHILLRQGLGASQREGVRDALQRAWPFLRDRVGRGEGPEIPPIWISKNLYRADFQIYSAIYNALYAFRKVRAAGLMK